MAATKHAQQIKQDSQEYLTTALLQLLQTTDLNDIKISQLVTRAGVSRMAFYRNFETLEDVLVAYFEPEIRQIFDEVLNHVTATEKLQRLSEFLEQFGADLKLSIQRHYEPIIRQIFFANMQRFYESEPMLQQVPATKRRYWIGFMSAGIYEIWRECLLDEQQDTLNDLHELIAALQTATFKAVIN
ncbi:MAG: TetR/AcrR family transcriptional regulator [Lactobacillaceae bacterium]|jgi:AcrR family transcriptional regulator|nr:TetR/AcrR family transcriptional regulator [Lactobacillaceae bacterium]